MKELLEYRVKLVEQLADAAREFCAVCEAFSDPYQVVDGEWTLHQIAAHMRDINALVYDERIRRTLSEDVPAFKSFNPDEWMASHYDHDEPLKKILDDFLKNMGELQITLQTMPRGDWARESSHATMGVGLTLQLWVERSLAHIEEHLQALKNARK